MVRYVEGMGNLSFKSRIILTFSALMIVLVIIMSRTGYYSVKEIYLEQLADQTRLLTGLIARQLNTRYLAFLNADSSGNLAFDYYTEMLEVQAEGMLLTNVFIFGEEFRVLVQTGKAVPEGYRDARLMLSRAEINALKVREAGVSLPFKGNDDRWYLWGFYRLDENHWLGIQENARRLEKVEALSLVFWSIGIVGVLFTILSGWFLARTLTKPVDRLVRFSSMLGEGKFSTPLPEGIRGELEMLASAMDKMRHDLARHHQEKEEILAQIAHEIRNPLGSIELMAGLIKEDLAEKGFQADYIQKILQEISGLKSLITAYLNFSRPLQARPEWVGIRELVEEVKALYQRNIERKKVLLRNADGSAQIWFDRHHLRQILINLVSNSLEVLENGGNIIIEFRRNGRYTFVSLSDDGPGIPEESLPSVFEPFFTNRSNGTGLGLAICKKLCRENGADISVENTPPQGCQFTIVQNTGSFHEEW